MPKGRYDRLLCGLPPDQWKPKRPDRVVPELPYRDQTAVDNVLGTRRPGPGTAFFDWPLWQMFPKRDRVWNPFGTATATQV